MKNFLIKILVSLLLIMYCIPASAEEYGRDKTASDIRYFVTSGTVTTHSSSSSKSKVIRRIKAGDYVYVDEDSLHYNGGEAWVKISGKDEYVLSYMLTIDDNPYYEPVMSDNVLESKTSIFKLGYYNLPKWLVISVFSVWILLAFLLTLTLAYNKYDIRWCPPNKKPVILKSPDPEYGYGQPKVLFFRSTPYSVCLTIVLNFLIAFLVTILLFVMIGGLVWVGTWAGRILLVGLFWIFYIGFFILAAGLLINALFGDEGKFWSFVFSVVSLFLAEFLGEWSGDVSYWGESLTEWGDKIFSTFNIFNVALYLVRTYWLTALIISVTPLLLFVSAAVLFMIFAGGLMLYESIKMKHYNVSHPCPFCGEHSEPAVYLSDGIPLHVPLRPGVWGMYSIQHPATGEKMPTLFINGKDRLERRCVHCDGLISANIGAEKHIAVAGVPNSGKSTLLYRIISELCRMKVGNESICSLTDNMGEIDTYVKSFLGTIQQGEKMDFYPDKTSEGRHKSIQLLAQNPSGSLPYRLYINDVAGEMFVSSSNKYEDAPFFKNTNVLIFALDPFTMNASQLEFSPEFTSWYEKNVGKKNEYEGKVDLDDAFNSLITTIGKYRTKKDFAKIKLMVTYVKTDTGYLDALNEKTDGASLREFAISEMGLENWILKLEDAGFDISYHAICASEDVGKTGISSYVSLILNNLGISFDSLTASQVAEKKAKYREQESNIRLARKERENFVPSDPNKDNSTKGLLIITGAFILAGLLIYSTVAINSNIQNRNYEKTLALVKRASSKPLYYDKVMSIIKVNMAEKSMKEDHKQDLTNIYLSADREKRKHISKLSSVLYANFESKPGRMSNFEVSLKYKAADLRTFKKYFEEFKTLAPNDPHYLKYSEKFDNLLNKYKIAK